MDEILRQVLTLFGEEFREHSLAMAQSLIQADRSESPEERKALMAEIYRRAHSVKGTSGTLGLFDLEDLAHGVETLRVSGEQLTNLERHPDELREIRTALEQRAEDARRIYWTLQAALSRAQRHIEFDLAAAVRDQVQQLQRNVSAAAGELSFRV